MMIASAKYLRAVGIPVRRPMTREERRMGMFSANVTLHSFVDDSSVSLSATVDTGASISLIPADVLERLGVTRRHQSVFEFADGRIEHYDVGELLLTAEDRTTHTWAVFGEVGAEPLLGCHALEGLMLAADPYAGRLIASPNAPSAQNGLQP